MARTTAPLLSFSAGGQIAKTQVYASWKGRPYVRRYAIPSNPKTVDQMETRNTFSWLNNVWKFMPAGALDAWNAYALNNRFTNRNGFMKINLGPLREEADLTNFIFSPAANGGLPAASMTLTPGNDQIQVVLVPPALPSGWTVDKAVTAMIRQQDPQTGTLYGVDSEEDATDPYDMTITGLASAQTYVVGGWFVYNKPDGTFAYGQALMDDALTT